MTASLHDLQRVWRKAHRRVRRACQALGYCEDPGYRERLRRLLLLNEQRENAFHRLVNHYTAQEIEEGHRAPRKISRRAARRIRLGLPPRKTCPPPNGVNWSSSNHMRFTNTPRLIRG